MRSASLTTFGDSARPGTSSVMSSACAWCWIIIRAYDTSAALGESSSLRSFWASSADRVRFSSPGAPGAITEGPLAGADLASSPESQPTSPSTASAVTPAATADRRGTRRWCTWTSCDWRYVRSAVVRNTL